MSNVQTANDTPKRSMWMPTPLPSLSITTYAPPPLAAMMAGGVMDMVAARIDHARKRLAQTIGADLTEAILNAIKSRDLLNGYEQNVPDQATASK